METQPQKKSIGKEVVIVRVFGIILGAIGGVFAVCVVTQLGLIDPETVKIFTTPSSDPIKAMWGVVFLMVLATLFIYGGYAFVSAEYRDALEEINKN